MPVHLLAFIVTVWLLAMLPGVGQALVLRQTLTRGRRAAWVTVSGQGTGLLIWSTAAAAGLSAILLANDTAYSALRVVGGIVLAYLGIGSLRTMWRVRICPDARVEVAEHRGAYLAGLATNLGNPKAGVFAISMLPQFIAPEGHVFLSGVLLGLIWVLTTAAWYVVFIWTVDRGRAMVTRPSVTTWLHGITGVILVLLGVGVVFAA